MNDYAIFIDQTLLNPHLSDKETVDFIDRSSKYNFASICVYPDNISLVKQIAPLMKTTTVIGFPSGIVSNKVKIYESQYVYDLGVDEYDMVINLNAFRSGKYSFIINEINSIKQIIGNRVLKVIVEAGVLSDKEKKEICRIVADSDADFIKTSTGFFGHGAEVKDIELFYDILKGRKRIKASGGIKTLEKMKLLINAGADRIGTSSGIEIINEVEGDIGNSY